jgi:hypothetical protein
LDAKELPCTRAEGICVTEDFELFWLTIDGWGVLGGLEVGATVREVTVVDVCLGAAIVAETDGGRIALRVCALTIGLEKNGNPIATKAKRNCITDFIL